MGQAAKLLRLTRRCRAEVRELAARPPARRPGRLPFGLAWMREYLPHYLTAGPSRMHLDLADVLGSFHLRRGNWLDVEAPRGAAKSTWLSRGYPLFCAVEGLEPYTLIASDTGDQAEGFLDAIRQELEGNAKLAADYPGATGVGTVWQSARLRLRNGCLIHATGAGGRVRGRTNRASRPSLVIVDDANEKADAYSPTLRRRKWDWFTKDLMSVGTARTNFLVAGTPIHREAISRRLRTAAGWSSRGYRAIDRWPERMDLWGEWERRLCNLADEDRDEAARGFYDANRPAMDAGAVVLWPEWESLYDLMRLRATIGASAFDSEKQDRPGTDGATEWPPELFGPSIWFGEWPEDVVCKLQGLDPSKGRTDKSSDWQAHGFLAMSRNGTMWVDADFRREPDYVGRSIEHYRHWQPRELWAESNNTMGLLIPEYRRQMRERGKPDRPLVVNYLEIQNSDPKLARIRVLDGYLRRGQLRVRNTPGGRMLVEQLMDVPNGEFDDGPDVVATLVRRMQELYGGAGK